MNFYQSKQWREFRLKKFKSDGFACSECGRLQSKGVILQVHHLKYIPGRRPWEYDLDECVTLCKGCHAAAHGLVIPQLGWDQVGWDDLGSSERHCELCGTEIRYVFTLFHADWPAMDVGSDCCDKLTGTNLASNEISKLVSQRNRRKRFIASPLWIQVQNSHIFIHKGNKIEIVRYDGAIKIRAMGQQGKKEFSSIEEAKGWVFDIRESGQLDQFILNRRVSRIPIH